MVICYMDLKHVLAMLMERGNHSNPSVKVSVCFLSFLLSIVFSYTLHVVTSMQLLIADPFQIPPMEWLTYLLGQFSQALLPSHVTLGTH